MSTTKSYPTRLGQPHLSNQRHWAPWREPTLPNKHALIFTHHLPPSHYHPYQDYLNFSMQFFNLVLRSYILAIEFVAQLDAMMIREARRFQNSCYIGIKHSSRTIKYSYSATSNILFYFIFFITLILWIFVPVWVAFHNN